MSDNTPVVIEIDGKRFEIQDADLNLYSEEKNGFYILKDEGQTYHIQLIDYNLYSGYCFVKINGAFKEMKVLRDIDVRIEKMGLNATHARKQQLVYAPMPGMVTSIKVSVGNHVEKGTPLIILEAMKMENVIAAPHDAVIKNILVGTGQAVERGLALIEFL